MKILLGLIVVMNGLYVYASESSSTSSSGTSRSLAAPASQAVLSASLIGSVRLVQPDPEKNAQFILLKDAITEQARDEAIALLIASKPIAQIQESAACLSGLTAELDALVIEGKKRAERVAWCKDTYAKYLQMHHEVNVDVDKLFEVYLEKRKSLPNGRTAEAASDDRSKITQMITLLNALQLADLTSLDAKERSAKIADIKLLLYAFDLKELRPRGSSQEKVATVSSEPLASIEEAMQAELLVKKQYRLAKVLEENGLLLASLEEEARLYEEKTAALGMQIKFAAERLEENKMKSTRYTELIQKLKRKPVRALVEHGQKNVDSY